MRSKRKKRWWTSGVYLIHLTRTDKMYIGSSTGGCDRLYQHEYHLRLGSHNNPKLQHAYDKYGAKRFTFAWVLRCDASRVRAEERKWMLALAHPDSPEKMPWFNLNPNTDQPPHRPPSPKTRALWSAQRLGRRHTADTKAKISATNRGRRHSAETIERMRAVHKRIGMHPNAIAIGVTLMRQRVAIQLILAEAWCDDHRIPRPLRNGRELLAEIGAAIERGDLRRGDRLPGIGSLANALGLSHATVSMALRRRAPVVRSGLTIRKTGTGLSVQAVGRRGTRIASESLRHSSRRTLPLKRRRR